MENGTDEWMGDADQEDVLSSSAPQEEDSGSEPSGKGEVDDGATEAGTDSGLSDGDGGPDPGEDGFETGENELPDKEEGLLGEDGEILEDGRLQESVVIPPQITAEEIKEAVYTALEEFFTEETILSVAVQEEEKGIDTPLEELGLTDALLLAVLLVVLGRAICDIIGGKNRWRK